MSAEWWIEAYEMAVEDLMDINGWDLEMARRELDDLIANDPKYLNDYIFGVVDAHK